MLPCVLPVHFRSLVWVLKGGQAVLSTWVLQTRSGSFVLIFSDKISPPPQCHFQCSFMWQFLNISSSFYTYYLESWLWILIRYCNCCKSTCHKNSLNCFFFCHHWICDPSIEWAVRILLLRSKAVSAALNLCCFALKFPLPGVCYKFCHPYTYLPTHRVTRVPSEQFCRWLNRLFDLYFIFELFL